MAQTIAPAELIRMKQEGRAFELLDVRTPREFDEIHAVGATLSPLDRLDPRAVMSARGAKSAEPLYLICRSGSRGGQACRRFEEAGFSNVVNVEGGTAAWEQAGGPLVRGRKAMSLERQVRITAGSIVAIGAILAMTISPWFAGLSAFIGAGLVFSGITDTCGMAMMLARMPWNRSRSTC